MEFVLTAPPSLSRVFEREIAALPATQREAHGRVLVNLGLQRPNTLLHDGRAWKRLPPQQIVADTRAALACRGRFALIVHASYAFLRGAETAEPGDKLRPIIEAALEAEQLVLDDPRPSWVVRLGYLYGPEARDLRLYRRAFRLGRPYWAGPDAARHDHLHSADAARAVLALTRLRPQRRPIYATDGTPVSFRTFMDHFAQSIGNPIPLRIPHFLRMPAHRVVAEEHMQMCELGVRGKADPQVNGFTPRFPNYRAGIDAVLAEWRIEP